MAVNGHDDKFTINDITFTVPPLEIRIDKEAANFAWQTIRTRNAQKVKSGHGVINISFSAVFVGEEAINDQLRKLVAQLRLTPICYAENTFLRHSLFPDRDPETKEPTIALILKSLTITAQAELKDTLVAHFNFAWFNYQPYCADLRFKTDILVPDPKSTPEQSAAWKKFYMAEMGELGISTGVKYVPVGKLDSSLSFLYNVFAINRDDFSKGSGFKRTDIKYETSNVREDGLTLFVAEQKLDCIPENDLVVTGVTVAFENIIAALPVIGHQYMTYQHIGSIDPRVIVRVMSTSDDGRRLVSGMWQAVEENALRFRHIPQEHLNITLVNQIASLCGLKTFITESLTEETIPGQPGTYALTLNLKGTDFSPKESLTQEFATLNEVRHSILNALLKQVKIVEQFDVVTREKRLTILQSNDDERNVLINDRVSKLIDKVKFLASEIALFMEDAIILTGNNETKKQANMTWGVVNKLQPPLMKDIIVSIIKERLSEVGFVGPSHSQVVLGDPEEIRSFHQQEIDAVLSGTGDQLATVDSLGIKDKFNAFFNFIVDLTDNIVLDGTIDLPEFAEAKKLADKVGAFSGKTAYPDFPALSIVAESEGIRTLDLNPDFYFYCPVSDTMESMIDPGYLQAAQEAARMLYVNEESTGSFLGDFINVLNNHVEETYKNRFAPDSSIRKSIDESLARLQAFFPSNRKNLSESKMRRESVSGLKYNDALARPRPLKARRFGVDPVGKFPDEGTETVCESGRSLDHYGDFKAVLDTAPQSYTPAEIKALGVFSHPIAPGTVVTSPFGPRPHVREQNPEASLIHKGIDLRAKVGTNILASASGRVIAAGLQDPNNDKVGFGNRVRIRHPNGYQTVYAHLSEILVKVGDKVESGQVIGRSGGDGSFGSGTSRAAHLHFEVIDETGTHIDPEKALAGGIFSRDESGGEGFQFGNSIFARSLESIQQDMLHGQGPSMKRAYPTFKLYFIEEDFEDRVFGFDDFFSYNSVKSIRVVRSRKVPADLCVIELTNISGILTNRKFRNEFNQKGEFSGNKPRNQAGEIVEEKADSPLLKNTIDENPIASLMLQEGTKILLKLGYDNNPSKLEDVFVGQIVEVELNDTDDLVTIVCQSYATELTQQIKGLEAPEKKSGWFLGTNDAVTTRLLSEMLQQPEVLHFGRWRRSRANGVAFGIFSTDRGSNTNLDLLSNKYEWNVTPQDDNIFAPVVSSNDFKSYFSVQNESEGFFTSTANFMMDTIGLPKGFNLNFINYYIDKMTIWDIFKEMELRHPGCIASPVPYMDARLGPRMTMFFGLPNQLYFARDPSPRENRRNNILQRTILDNEEEFRDEYNLMSDLYGLEKDDSAGVLKTRIQGIKNILKGQIPILGVGKTAEGAVQVVAPMVDIKSRQRDAYSKHLRKKLAIADRSIRPFRSYHVLTSNNHIVQNNIRASSLDVYNTVSIEYTEPSFLKSVARNVINKATLGFNGGDAAFPAKGIFRLKADAGIPDEEIQEVFLQYPSCEGETMAEFYALGALKQTLRDIYKGEIVIIGNPSIKPYDICYVFDEYTDMVGPVEVEQVIHYFSQETGFITEITPDICVTINEWTTLGTMDVVGLTVENWIDLVFRRQTRKEQNPSSNLSGTGVMALGITLPIITGLRPPGTPGLVAAGGVGLLAGAFVANKLVHWSKYRHPITFSPLLHKGRPFMAAMSSKTINANWWTNLKQWFKEGAEGVPLVFSDVADKLVIGAGTGKLGNLGVSTSNTSLFGGSR